MAIARIVGVGEILWDSGKKGRTLGGAPANFAYHAMQLGAQATAVSCVGKDQDGQDLLAAVRSLGLKSDDIQVDDGNPTGKVEVTLQDGNASYIIHQPSAWDFLKWTPELKSLAAECDVVCYGTLGCRAAGSSKTIETFLDSTRKDCVRIFDVNLRKPFFSREKLENGFRRATVVKLNEEELALLTGLFDQVDEKAFFHFLFQTYGVALIAVTLGAAGSRLISPQTEWRAAGQPVTVADTIGAGDSFTAALAVGLCQGIPKDQLLSLCNTVGSYVASQTGATPQLPESLTQLFAFDQEELHRKLLQAAARSVSVMEVTTRHDAAKPIFHVMAPAGWINDPNGPFFFRDQYHLFFQHNPYGSGWGNMTWAHVRSRDLVFWEREPLAMTPLPGGYDKDGVFSGCCVLDGDVPTLVYTAVNPETQALARSYDGLVTWHRDPLNPVIAAPPFEKPEGFRDPFVWGENGDWHMLLGSGTKERGGNILYYRGKDLRSWQYVGIACEHPTFGSMWECPAFFPLGQDLYGLLISPYSGTQYTVGTWKDGRFSPQTWHPFDLSPGRTGIYAPNVLVEKEKSRVICWSWINAGTNMPSLWRGVMTLPRILSLGSDSTLHVEPAPELTALREAFASHADLLLKPGAKEKPIPLPSLHCEFEADLEISPDARVACCFQLGRDFSLAFVIDRKNKILLWGKEESPLPAALDRDRILLRLFLDHCVMEAYLHGYVFTGQANGPHEGTPALTWSVENGAGKIHRLDIWNLKSIWK